MTSALLRNAVRTRTRHLPKRFRPGHSDGGVTFATLSVIAMPQTESLGDASTSRRSPVASRKSRSASFWPN